MLRIIAGVFGGIALLNILLYLCGIIMVGQFVALPFAHLGRALGISGEGTDVMTIEPISVQWSGERGKAITLRVTNTSGQPMERFRVQCLTNRANNWVEVTDMSGILPGASEVRSYAIPDVNDPTTITTVRECLIKGHFRGKPRAYSTDGGYKSGDGMGDRLPDNQSGLGAMAPNMDGTPMSTIDRDEADPTLDTD